MNHPIVRNSRLLVEYINMKSLSKGEGEKRTAHDGCLDDQNEKYLHQKSSAVRARCNKTAVQLKPHNMMDGQTDSRDSGFSDV